MSEEVAEGGAPASTPEVDQAILSEARQMGWQPLEKYKGDPEKWVDATTYVSRGREIMPLLRANNAKLLGELSTVREQLKSANDAIEQLRVASAEITAERVKAVKKELLASIRTAREEGNVEQEDELTEKLSELRTAEKAQPAKPVPSNEPAVDPAFTAWMAKEENSWFGRDRRRTSLAMGIAQELRSDHANDGLVGQAFYERIAEEVEATLNPKPPKADRVEGSRGGGAGGGGNGKSYSSLPAEAKAVCDRQASSFVGEGKSFKDLAAWRNHYTKIYYGDQ